MVVKIGRNDGRLKVLEIEVYNENIPLASVAVDEGAFADGGQFRASCQSSSKVPALLAARGLAVIGQQLPEQPFLQMLSHAGFVKVAEAPNEEIVIGLVGKFWRPVQNQVKLADGAAFLRFDDPTCAKAAMNFYLAPTPNDGVRLTTETRVRGPDAASRRRFRLYWALIGPFSGLIRIEILRRIKQAAEGVQ